MSAIVGRVIHERRERAKRLGRRRPPIAAAAAAAEKTPDAPGAAKSDSSAVEAAVAAAVELEVDERLALRRSGGCFLPCLKGAWLCSALGLALIALGSVMCFFAFHSDLYSRLAASSSPSADAASSSSFSFSDNKSTASVAASEVAVAEAAAAAAGAATAANELPVSAAAAARSASTPVELASGGSILRSFLKSLSYLGPTVIGVGAFVIVVSCVTILDRRELIVSALKSREAQMNKKNKDTVYAAVVARYMRRRQMGGGEQRPRSRADNAPTPMATDRPYAFIASAIRQLHDCGDAIALRGALVDGEGGGGRGRRRRSSSCRGRGGGEPRADDDDRASTTSGAAAEPTEQPLDVLWSVTSLNASAGAPDAGCYASGGAARAEVDGSAVSPDRHGSAVPFRDEDAAITTHVGVHSCFGVAARLESPSGPPAYSAIVASTVFDAQPVQADPLPPDRRHSLGFRGGGTQHIVAVASV